MTLLQHLWGRTPVLGPSPWQRSSSACQKKNTYSILGPTGTLSPKVSLKTSFPLPTRLVEYPHGPSIIFMGSHPCALTHSLATLGSYPCSTIVRMTPFVDSCTHSPSENEFSNGTHIPCMAHLQHPQGRTTGLCPGLWQQSTAGCQKKPILSPPVHFRPRYPLKRVFPGYPPGGLSTHMDPL